MKRFLRFFYFLFLVFLFNFLIVHPAVMAALTPGGEQEQFERDEKVRKAQAQLESKTEEDSSVDVGEEPFSAEEEAAPAGAALLGARPAQTVSSSYGSLVPSVYADELTLVIEQIRVPEDSILSPAEVQALVEPFQGKQVKLSEVIYLTESIADLYASAEIVNRLSTARDNFEEDEPSADSNPVTFVIKDITAPENAPISQDEVLALSEPFEGKEVTLSELRHFARNIDRLYTASDNIAQLAAGTFVPGGIVVGGGQPAGSGSRAYLRGRKVVPAEEALPREDVPFLIETIKVTGSTAVSSEEIQKITAPYQNKELKLSDAKLIAEEITRLYRSKGFITCRAYIPPQNLSSKVLEIRILEGKLGKVKVRGNQFFKKGNITRFISSAKEKVLLYSDLKKQVAKMNLHPDREVKAVIVPGKAFGTSDLLLDVKDRHPLHIGAEINNFGTEATGRERYSVSVRHTNLFGYDDILVARAQFGEEVFAAGVQYAFPIGPWDTQVGASFNYTDVNIGEDFEALDIAGEAYSYSVFFNQPIYDGQRLDLTWTGSFESKTIDNSILGVDSSRDELRMLHTGLNIDHIDPWGRTFIVNDFTFGLPWLGASEKHDPRLSRADAGATFFKYNGSINRIHPVYDSTYFLFKGNAQFTPDRLVSAEQFDIGGVYSVRGYPQSDYLGDYGIGGSVELRVPFYFIPRSAKVPWTDVPLWNRLSFVGFLDAAHAGLKSPAVGESKTRNYMGIGGGVRFDLPRNLVGRFEWGEPIGADDPLDGSDGMFYFSVSGDLL
jgi:hemolysin activation/secretion protein